jgi:hypothetical protein
MSNSNRDRKRQIKIYQRTYSLPVLSVSRILDAAIASHQTQTKPNDRVGTK